MSAPIKYIEKVVLTPDEMHDQLWTQLNWVRIENTPRSEYYHAKNGAPYTYGRGRGIRTYESQPATALLEHLWGIAETYSSCKYDVVFLNGYNDQSDHLGWHSDDSPEMDDRRPIAIISLGAERFINFRKIPFNEGKCIACNGSGKYDNFGSPDCGSCEGTGRETPPAIERLLLNNGSLCLMQPGMQDTHQHKIPKADRVVGKRISLTFRGVV